MDYDADGNIVGIDIDNASSKVDMRELIISKLPAQMETLVARLKPVHAAYVLPCKGDT